MRYEFTATTETIIVDEYALINILSNAFKHMPDECGILFKIDDSDKMVHFTAQGHWIGIPEGVYPEAI